MNVIINVKVKCVAVEMTQNWESCTDDFPLNILHTDKNFSRVASFLFCSLG